MKVYSATYMFFQNIITASVFTAVILMLCISITSAQEITLLNTRSTTIDGSQTTTEAIIVDRDGVIRSDILSADVNVTVNGTAGTNVFASCATYSPSTATLAVAFLMDCAMPFSSNERELQIITALEFIHAAYAPRLPIENTVLANGNIGLPLLKPISADPDSAIIALHNLPRPSAPRQTVASFFAAVSQLQQTRLEKRILFVFTDGENIPNDNNTITTLRNNQIQPVFICIGGRAGNALRTLSDSLGGLFVEYVNTPSQGRAAARALVEILQRGRIPCTLSWRQPSLSCNAVLSSEIAIPNLFLRTTHALHRAGNDIRTVITPRRLHLGPIEVNTVTFAPISITYDVNTPNRPVTIEARVVNRPEFTFREANNISTTATIINTVSGREVLLPVYFAPEFYGLDTAFIEIRAYPPSNPVLECSDTIMVLGLAFPPLFMSLPDTSVASNECVELPAVLRLDRSLSQLTALGLDTIKAFVRVGSFMVEPQDSLSAGDLTYYDRFIQLQTPANQMAAQMSDSTVATLSYCAMLGRADTAHVVLSHFEISRFPGFRFPTQSGVIRLADICREGGTRLYYDFGEFTLRKIAPNPSATSVSVEYSLAEHGMTEMFLVDLNGNRVRQVFQGLMLAGTYMLDIPRGNLPAGVYTLILRSPTQQALYKLMFTN